MRLNLLLSVAILGAVLLDAGLMVRLRRLRKAAMSAPGSPAGSGPAGADADGDAPALAAPTTTDDPGGPPQPPYLAPPARAAESAERPAWEHQNSFGDGQILATGAGAQARRLTEIRSSEPTVRARDAEDDRPRARDAEDDRPRARDAEDDRPRARDAEDDRPRARDPEDDRPRARDPEDDMTAPALAARTAPPIVAGTADAPAPGDLGRGSVRRSQWSGPPTGASAGRAGRRKR